MEIEMNGCDRFTWEPSVESCWKQESGHSGTADEWKSQWCLSNERLTKTREKSDILQKTVIFDRELTQLVDVVWRLVSEICWTMNSSFDSPSFALSRTIKSFLGSPSIGRIKWMKSKFSAWKCMHKLISFQQFFLSCFTNINRNKEVFWAIL